ncbi:MAG: hypothetical protein H8E12_06265 [Rhodobacteraceae bacterium]|nr:hypothetical protein [Paracoccaceae bacterium]
MTSIVRLNNKPYVVLYKGPHTEHMDIQALKEIYSSYRQEEVIAAIRGPEVYVLEEIIEGEWEEIKV